MKITKITVSYAETHSFGNHHNVKPSVTYEADLEADDIASAKVEQLAKNAVFHVQRLVDNALEENGYSPIYSEDDLYQIMVSHKRKTIILVEDNFYEYPSDFFRQDVPLRWIAAVRAADRKGQRKGYKFSGDFSVPGDFEELERPDLPEIHEDEIPF